MNLPMPGLHLYVYTIRMAAERFSTATAQDISIFWMEKQETFLTATRSVRESSKHLLLYIKVIWLWEPEIVKYGGWNCSDAVPPHFIYAIGETKVRACTKNLGDCRDNEKNLQSVFCLIYSIGEPNSRSVFIAFTPI